MKYLWLILLVLCSVLAIAGTALAEGEYQAVLSQLENNKGGEITRANKDFEYVDTQLKNNFLSNMDTVRGYRNTSIANARNAYESSNKDTSALTRYNNAVDQAWQEYDRAQLKSEDDYSAQYARSKSQRDARINEANNQFEAAKSRIDKVKEKYEAIANRPMPAADHAGYDNAVANADARRAAAVDKATKDFDNRVSKADKDLDNTLNRAVEQHRASGTGPESEAMYERTRGMAILKNEDDWAAARNKRDADLAKIEEDYKNASAAAKKKYNIEQPEPQMSPEDREAYRKELAQAIAPQPQAEPAVRPAETMPSPPPVSAPPTSVPLADTLTPLANMSLEQLDRFLPGSVADAVFLKREDLSTPVVTLRRMYGQPGQYGSYVEIHVNRETGSSEEMTAEKFEKIISQPGYLENMGPYVDSYSVKKYGNYPVVIVIQQGGQGRTAFFDYSYYRFNVICSNRYNSMNYIDAGIESLLSNLNLR